MTRLNGAHRESRYAAFPKTSTARKAVADAEQTTITRMKDGTREDYAEVARHSERFFQGLPDRILRHLELLEGETGGYAVDRLCDFSGDRPEGCTRCFLCDRGRR